MTKRSISKGVIKDIAIVVTAVVVIWIGLTTTLGTQNPLYVVASGSMIPALEVYDIIICARTWPIWRSSSRRHYCIW